MLRKPFVGGNWKCNGSRKFINSITNTFNNEIPNIKKVDVCLAPPNIYLERLQNKLRPDWLISAQNCYKEPKGAYTGEISCEMLKDMNIDWVILGHSERRHKFNESSKLIGEKTKMAISKDMNVIFCLGEKLEQRQNGETKRVVVDQLQSLSGIKDWSKIVLAYDPVWAIGTGVVAKPYQAEEVHSFLRQWFAENVSKSVSDQLRIIYGGSVSPNNSVELIEKPNVDGFLVGGYSLKPGFIDIIKNVIKKY
ncbi:triosephosphate isomerase [Anaeramoeba flamelloides]|uniref:Triosephosphate isomerase n=1 Tax=Anaeramoeba flamelloides TaxID=1746091 RepID=A0AAV7YF05_9EUKA|nr:triosephosphate isomerase [Anaeramoeba flamelloides]